MEIKNKPGEQKPKQSFTQSNLFVEASKLMKNEMKNKIFEKI